MSESNQKCQNMEISKSYLIFQANIPVKVRHFIWYWHFHEYLMPFLWRNTFWKRWRTEIMKIAFSYELSFLKKLCHFFNFPRKYCLFLSCIVKLCTLINKVSNPKIDFFENSMLDLISHFSLFLSCANVINRLRKPRNL